MATLPSGIGLPPNSSLRQLYLMNTCWTTDLEAGNFHGIVEGGGFGLVAESTEKKKKKQGKKKGKKTGKKKGKKDSQKKSNERNALKTKKKTQQQTQFTVGPGPDMSSHSDSDSRSSVIQLPPGWKPAIPASKLGPEHTERLRALRTFSRATVQEREDYLYLRLVYPYEAGLLLFEKTDQVKLENDGDSGEDSNEDPEKDGSKDEDRDRDPTYRSAFTWRCVENEANTYYDTKRVMKRAFESDWAYSRIESLLIGDSAELERVHSVMQKNFRFLHELFRYESTQEAVGNDLRITLKGWVGFCKMLKLVGSGSGSSVAVGGGEE